MQPPDPHRIPYTPIQQNPWPVWPYAGPGGGGGSLKHAYAPTGGIPKASWNSSAKQMTPGKVLCRIATRVAGVYEPTADTVMVENPVGTIVGVSGKPMTIGRNTSGAWTVLVEDCTGSSSGGPFPDPDVEDPIDGGGSSSSSFGMGV